MLEIGEFAPRPPATGGGLTGGGQTPPVFIALRARDGWQALPGVRTSGVDCERDVVKDGVAADDPWPVDSLMSAMPSSPPKSTDFPKCDLARSAGTVKSRTLVVCV